MKAKTLFRWLAVLCLAACLSSVLPAQAGQGRGRLTGSVRDEAGRPVAGALIGLEFRDSGRKLETASDAKGEWVFMGVGTGNRARLSAAAAGFHGVVLYVDVSQLNRNKPVAIVLRPLAAGETEAGAEDGNVLVTKTYSLRHVSPNFVRLALRVYFHNESFSDGSNLISITMPKKNVAAFEEQLRKLDEPKANVLLRVFTVIASKEGKGSDIENKDLKRVLAEVSQLLSFKAYVLDGASAIDLKEGAGYGQLLLSSDSLERLWLEFSRVALVTDGDGRRSVRFGLQLEQKGGLGRLLNTETEVAENGYLVAGVSRLGGDGRSLVLVINAEIR